MSNVSNIYYGLVYKEQIRKYLVNMGLSLKEADEIFKYAGKKQQVPDHLRIKFTGNQKQWDLLVDASRTAVNFSHAVSNFLGAEYERAIE